MNIPLIVFIAVGIVVVIVVSFLGAALYVTGQWREITGEDVKRD